MKFDIKSIEARVVIALIVSAMVSFILVSAVFHKIPPENKDLVNSLATFIVGAFTGSIIGFYFSDSKKHPEDKGGVVVNTTDAVNVDQTEKPKV